MKRCYWTAPVWFTSLYLLIYANGALGAFVSQPRWGQAVAVVDNLLYAYGGKTDQFGSYSYTSAPTTNDLFILDLSQGFDPTSPPWNYVCGSEDSSSRQGQQLAWHSLSAYNTSQLLLFGGDGGPNSPIVLPSQTNSAQLLDVSDSSDPTWISEQEGWAGQPSRRIHHTATSVGGKVYLIGGEKDDGSSFGYSDHYVFDPSTPSFTQLPTDNGPPDIYGHGSVVLSDGRLLVFGGYSQSESSLVPFSTIWSLNTRQSDLSWTTESVSEDSVPPGRRAFAYTWLEGDRVLIHGGSDAQFQTSYSDGWILDTTTNPMTWSNVSALTQVGARRDHFAIQVGSQVLFCFGYGTNAGSSVSLLVFDYDQDAFTSSFAPQSGPSLTTLPAPTGTDGSSSGGSHGSGPGGTGSGSNPINGSGKPSSPTDPGSDGGNEDGDGGDGDDKKKTAVIAVASIFGVLAIALAAGLLVIVVIRRRRSRRQFYLLNNEDEHPRPGAFPPWELAGISILPWLKVRRALARGEKTRIADKREGWTVLGLGRPRERVDMLANEDASELGIGRRQPGRLGSGDSRSWYSFHDGTSGHERYESGASIGRLFSGSLTSLKNIGSGVRRVISGGSAKSQGHRREWTDISLPLDPYDTHGDGEGLLLHDKDLSYGVKNSLDELEGDIALAARPRGGKEGSNSSEYVDPFQDQVEGEVLFDVSPSVMKRGSLDDSEPSSSNAQSQKEVNARSSQSTLSQTSVVPQLPPLVPAASKSTSDGPSSSSLLDGSNAGHSTSSSQHAALSVTSSTRPRTSSIINSSAPPSSPVKRSDSWWARFKRSRAGSFRENSQDLGKASFSRLDLDFRDPNPPPGRLGAIKEVSGGSSGAAESPRASHIVQPEESHEKTKSGSSSAGRLYLVSGHEQSTTSLKTSRTADSAALERLAGKMDVAFREATGTSIDCGSSFSESVGRRASHERDTTWSTLGSGRHAVEGSEDQDIVDGAVLDGGGRNIVQSPTEIATAPDLPSDRIAESIRMVSQSLSTSSPQSTTSLSATLKGLKGKNPISPGTVATRVANYERHMSIEIFSSPEATPTLSSPSPVSSRTPRSQNSSTTLMSATPTPKPIAKRKVTNVKYGLVQRPELFIANPDRDRHSIGGSSDT